MKRKGFKGIILLALFFLLLAGCARKGKEMKTIQGDPEILYKQGLALFNQRDYAEALKKFDQLKSNFPDSPPYAVWTELKVADCHFLKKEYVEALADYEEFKKIHPTHEEMPYVQFQIGMSYFNQMRTPDRDQTPTKKALSSFEYLIANYPPSLFTQKAKERIGICKERLADHEFVIGNFYYVRGKFQAAAGRFEGLLAGFPKNPGEDTTLFLLGKSYLEIGEEGKARGAFDRIVAEYPKSSHFKEAKSILDQGVKGKKVPVRSEMEGPTAIEQRNITLAKFEEEGNQPVPMKEDTKGGAERTREVFVPPGVTGEPLKSIAPDKDDRGQKPFFTGGAVEKEQARLSAQAAGQEKEVVDEIKIEVPPAEEPQRDISRPAEPQRGEKSEGEKKVALLPGARAESKGKDKPGKEFLPEPGAKKLMNAGQPVDITSDRVETFSKDNLILFKGNVMARQKDIVIYADSIEAIVFEDGKGIERIVADGNVKIQQGLRVANCQKAIFYNLDQKVILTGNPRIQEGDSVVSGEEIVFDIELNRVEVKGGPGGRGKAKIDPGEIEKSR